MDRFDLNRLEKALLNAAAIRSRTRLEPAGGTGDKVFPPTYVKEGRATTKYALESRRLEDGRESLTVLLDSVASQANRMEEALLEGWRRGELSFPLVQVDFSHDEELRDLEQITSLTAPHRIADALLRDSLLEGRLFRQTKVGKEITDARPNHATGMYKYCPTALIFGVWDSTGPKGGLGAKFQRCLVSEIVGLDAIPGVKVASRLDPSGIQNKAGPIYKHKDPEQEWTLDPKEAEIAKGKPVEFSRGNSEGKKGSPSAANHSNIPPSIDDTSGGVTMSEAVQTVVLSLAGLRRLRFQTQASGEPIPAERRDEAENAARTALAALALAAVVYQRENDFDLRSRSLLVAKEPLVFEIVGRNGGEPERFTLSKAEAAELVKAAEGKARGYGLGWDPKPVTLLPAPKLAELIRKSRELTRSGEAEES